jgi:aspartate/methionine/tyrosine aminotransferase
VYEHLVFDGAQHISLRSLPGMADRAVRLGSAGKTFSFTAWKARVVVGECGVFQCQQGRWDVATLLQQSML